VRALLIVIVLGGCETGDPPDLSAQLVARYALDDLAAGVVTDASGNNHHGMCTTCPLVEAGKVGSAYRFDGGDQQIDVPPAAALDTVTRGVSAAAWVKLDAPPPAIAGCALVKGTMWSLCVTPAMNPMFGTAISTTAALAPGTWHHVAATYDLEVKRVYLDGAQVAAMDGRLTTEAGGLTIGAELIGLVDDAHVYSGVLTDEEIMALATP
jgi:hypothetical protein